MDKAAFACGRQSAPYPSNPGLQIPGQDFQFIQNFGKYRKLMPFQGFVEQFRAAGRVINAVVVGVIIPVQVVVLQQQVFPRQPGDIGVSVAADAQNVPGVAGFVLFPYAQHHPLLAMDFAAQVNSPPVVAVENQGVLKAEDEGMFAQPDFVDALVVVPGVPSVGVLARSNFTP